MDLQPKSQPERVPLDEAAQSDPFAPLGDLTEGRERLMVVQTDQEIRKINAQAAANAAQHNAQADADLMRELRLLREQFRLTTEQVAATAAANAPFAKELAETTAALQQIVSDRAAKTAADLDLRNRVEAAKIVPALPAVSGWDKFHKAVEIVTGSVALGVTVKSLVKGKEK